jgi:hypothetical protein
MLSAIGLLSLGLATSPSQQAADPYSRPFSFSGTTGGRDVPDVALLNDAPNAAVLRACVVGCTLESLAGKQSGADAKRLDGLLAGHLLVTRNGTYRAALPVVTGAKRTLVRRLVESRVRALASRIEDMPGRLRAAVGSDDMLFHLLWSRVFDTVWAGTWSAAFPDTAGPPSAVWVIDPYHPYSVGTNYDQLPGGGSMATTWSPAATEHLVPLSRIRAEMSRAAWTHTIRPEAQSDLEQLGLVGQKGFTGFFYHRGDQLDMVLDKLRGEYQSAVADAYDYHDLARQLDLDAGSVFVILLHETAYELLKHLAESGALMVPQGLYRVRDLRTRLLTSMRLDAPPQPEDEAVAEYQRSGGTPATVRVLRELLEQHPESQRTWLYLGLSLYDTREYGQALAAFRTLAAQAAVGRDEGERRTRDWAHVWMGHVYDLLGERDKALAEYRSILQSESRAQYSQYGIGPVTAGEWARQRVEVPFTRR